MRMPVECQWNASGMPVEWGGCTCTQSISSAFISSAFVGTGRGGGAAAATGGGATAFFVTTGTALVALGRPPEPDARAAEGAGCAPLAAVFFMAG